MNNRITHWSHWPEQPPAIPQTGTCQTLQEILDEVPFVHSILAKARSIRHSRKANWKDYEGLKSHIKSHIGWNADNPRVQTSHCYDLVLRAMVDALHI